MDDTAFILDKGRFVTSGKLGIEDITFDARLEGLPVEVLNLITPAEFMGSVNGRLQVVGRLDRPEAFLEFRVDDMQLKGAAFEGLPPARLLTHIRIDDDRLQADLSLKRRLGDRELRAVRNLCGTATSSGEMCQQTKSDYRRNQNQPTVFFGHGATPFEMGLLCRQGSRFIEQIRLSHPNRLTGRRCSHYRTAFPLIRLAAPFV